MSGVAWWTCALLALASARIYERCELARELQRLGVAQEHIPTWVCIAFHESRFDTAARNPHSGDHGLLQISELFWCGDGKVCGVPCSAFRDEDISDDVDCALQIHEEHTRLQGDGFLAWVVYPQHCKHNTKKYLADCDNLPKSTPAKTIDKPRGFVYDDFNLTEAYDLKEDDFKPAYLMISSFLRGSYRNELEQDKYVKHDRMEWLNFKIDDIDKLKLPVFSKKSNAKSATTSPVPTTQFATTSRRTELNRYNTLPNTYSVTNTKNDYRTISPAYSSKYPTTPNPFTSRTVTTYKPKTTTRKFLTIKNIGYNSTTSMHRPLLTSLTTYKSTSTKTLLPLLASKTDDRTNSNSYFTTSTTPRTTVSYKSRSDAASALNNYLTQTTTQRSLVLFTSKSKTAISNNYFTASTSSIAPINKKPTVFTSKPKTGISFNNYLSTQTTLPTSSVSITRKKATAANFNNYFTESTTSRPKFKVSSTSGIVTTNRQFRSSKINLTPSLSKSSTAAYTTRRAVTLPNAQATQSIFDLYLNPTKRPKLAPYSYRPLDSRYKLSIFSDGTTSAPALRTVRSSKYGDVSKNQFPRQTLH